MKSPISRRMNPRLGIVRTGAGAHWHCGLPHPPKRGVRISLTLLGLREPMLDETPPSVLEVLIWLRMKNTH
jgi:hypothetical protein